MYSGRSKDITLDISIEPRGDYLYIRASGPFELRRAKELFDQIAHAGRKHSVKLMLVDITDVTQYENRPVIERFEIASYVGETQPRGTRIAFLFSEKQMLPDKFDETVARNRGGNVITTADLKSALEWLGVASDKNADGGDVQ